MIPPGSPGQFHPQGPSDTSVYTQWLQNPTEWMWKYEFQGKVGTIKDGGRVEEGGSKQNALYMYGSVKKNVVKDFQQ